MPERPQAKHSEALEFHASRIFSEQFDGRPDYSSSAPARVNLIGEHVDYNGGIALPFAIDLRTAVAARVRSDDRLRVWSESQAELIEWPDIGQLNPANCPVGWFRYPAGVVALLQRCGQLHTGLDLAVASEIPFGAGLSSSAALSVAVLTAIIRLTGARIDPWQAARLCQACEHEFAGVPCGLMDPLTSMLGQTDHLLAIDFDRLTSRAVPFADRSIALLTIHSGVRHELSTGEYGKRKSECDEVARLLGVESLRHVSAESLPDVRRRLPEKLAKRLRHVVSEIDRVQQAVECCQARQWSALGDLLCASHESLSRDFEVSCREVDLLQRMLIEHPAVLGARMTGGGFGGCLIALVRRDQWPEVIPATEAAYQAAAGAQLRAWLTDPAAGAWSANADLVR